MAGPLKQNSRIYLYPKTGRGGLGNKLFPWARAVVFSKRLEAQVISPYWSNLIKVGPYLRKEKDKRHYFFIFSNKGYIKGLRKAAILSTLPRINERDIDALILSEKKYVVIEFEGFTGKGISPYFESLLPYQGFIRDELVRISRKSMIPMRPNFDFIGVHIRMGDFIRTDNDTEVLRNAGALNYRIPLYWYSNAIDQLRSQLKSDIKVLIFSDGRADELDELLSKKNTELVKGNGALTDMFFLSYSNVVIASGSTFSMWAVFLGQMPSIWFPGLTRGNLISDATKRPFQLLWEEGEMPGYFVDLICKGNS